MRARSWLAGLVGLIGIAVAVAGWQRGEPDTPFHPRPSRISPGTADGLTSVLTPDRIAAAAIGSYELRLTVGASGLPSRSAILVGFPKAWFVNPFPLPKRLQSDDPAKPHFLSVRSSRENAALKATVDTIGFTGKIERFNQTIAIANNGAALRPGDVISVTLSNTTAPYIAGADRVHVAVDRDGSGRYLETAAGAPYSVTAGPTEDFTLLGPTEAVVGRPVQLQIAAFDRFWNLAEEFSGSVRVTDIDRDRTLRISRANRGTGTISWTPAREGFYFPRAIVLVSGRERVAVAGNPIRVFDHEPAVRTYWGELHSHSSISADGIGNDPFSYARGPARLDFFAATEHADDDGSPRANAIRPEDWEAIKERVRRFDEPGRFVTLLAYECSFSAPSGHHNVFFRGVDGEPWPAALMGSVQNLWAKIRAGDAITIPHHMGILFGGFSAEQEAAGPGLQPIVTVARGPVTQLGASVDWSIHDPLRRPLLEMYSLHGSSEIYDPSDPLAYENAHFAPSRSVPGSHYARDAWAAGLELGVVAATDNHSAQPGQPQGGVAAVRALRLTREAVFDALAGKHTYATTGQRMYLDLTVAGLAMGSAGKARGPISGSVTIAAPSDIARAEIVRLSQPSNSYSVAAHWDGAGRLLQTTFTDVPEEPRVMYYLRVVLKEPVRGREVRGWSSPVWLDLDRR
ncbi:MAG TPA: DUF3604 domain-containing protein [Vicinamibacterales bacterium]